MSFPRHYHPAIGIQGPPLLSTVFCQPIAVGGPNGLGLDFPAWPILVPGGGKEKVLVCYTRDTEFRNTYLEKGYCGLDASFRNQFKYNCPEQIIHIAPTVRKDDRDHRTEVHHPGEEDSSERLPDEIKDTTSRLERRLGRNPKGDYDMPSLVQSIRGFFSTPSRRHLMNIMHSIRRYFERFNGDVETVVMVIIYLTFYPILCLPFLFACIVAISAMAMALEKAGLVRYSQTWDGGLIKAGNAPKLSVSGRPRRSKSRPPAANTEHRRRPLDTPVQYASPERNSCGQDTWPKPETYDVPETVAAKNSPPRRRVGFSLQRGSSPSESRQLDPELDQDTDDGGGLATPSSMASLGSTY